MDGPPVMGGNAGAPLRRSTTKGVVVRRLDLAWRKTKQHHSQKRDDESDFGTRRCDTTRRRTG